MLSYIRSALRSNSTNESSNQVIVATEAVERLSLSIDPETDLVEWKETVFDIIKDIKDPEKEETLEELDRFIDAMVAIREEIRLVEDGHWPREDNPLKHAPHCASSVLKTDWPHPYGREVAAASAHNPANTKYWPPVGRVDNVYGDRNLFCSCLPVEALAN